jgi:hypothetical protein
MNSPNKLEIWKWVTNTVIQNSSLFRTLTGSNLELLHGTL